MSVDSKATLDDLNDELSFHLHKIKRCFKCKMEVVLLIRDPLNDEHDVAIGDMSFDEARKLLTRRESGVSAAQWVEP